MGSAAGLDWSAAGAGVLGSTAAGGAAASVFGCGVSSACTVAQASNVSTAATGASQGGRIMRGFPSTAAFLDSPRQRTSNSTTQFRERMMAETDPNASAAADVKSCARVWVETAQRYRKPRCRLVFPAIAWSTRWTKTSIRNATREPRHRYRRFGLARGRRPSSANNQNSAGRRRSITAVSRDQPPLHERCCRTMRPLTHRAPTRLRSLPRLQPPSRHRPPPSPGLRRHRSNRKPRRSRFLARSRSNRRPSSPGRHVGSDRLHRRQPRLLRRRRVPPLRAPASYR